MSASSLFRRLFRQECIVALVLVLLAWWAESYYTFLTPTLADYLCYGPMGSVRDAQGLPRPPSESELYRRAPWHVRALILRSYPVFEIALCIAVVWLVLSLAALRPATSVVGSTALFALLVLVAIAHEYALICALSILFD